MNKLLLTLLIPLTLTGCGDTVITATDIRKGECFCKDKGEIFSVVTDPIFRNTITCLSGDQARPPDIKLTINPDNTTTCSVK